MAITLESIIAEVNSRYDKILQDNNEDSDYTAIYECVEELRKEELKLVNDRWKENENEETQDQDSL